MEIALVVGLSLLLAISIGSVAFLYSYYIYTKNRVFTKIKFPILIVSVLSIVILCLIILISLIGANFNSKPNVYFPVYLALSITLLVIAIGYLVCFILIYVFNNKNKIEYSDIPIVDWKAKIKELEDEYGTMEEIKVELSAKEPKYYNSMLEYYKTIVFRMGQKNLPISETIADIVTFNDAFTHKWSGFLNVYQLLLTYKFCAVFQKNPGQK